ncbi:YqhA family protein [Candidatus Sulfurimonas marisnigri]|uniref:YqhA family protein n=1 Tax=Candidatus Sulfurimonas marisnigri TaxID=2740405 RepID=A0A7S7RR54_9BACT|nr:YqhA family protein [Candidatus Sulfurimonas marisnigri]QOY55334.1 YqhA family protein [Candidatus Sulfurimonas marisnigri]
MIEKLFESSLWSSRFIIILAVIFGLMGAVILFIVASFDIYDTAKFVVTSYLNHAHPENFHEDVVGGIIGAVDLYLIGVVMLLFSFGLYELFISDIDAARDEAGGENKILSIHSLDQLKDKISKVIVMVLVVGFFQKVGHTHYDGALDMLYFALSITAVAVGLFFLGKVGKSH